MAQYRSQSPYQIGSEPPQSVWTIVSGDTASFKMYVQDDSGSPLVIEDWSIEMNFNRESSSSNPILTITPAADPDDGPGEFTVFLAYDETEILQTNDEFDIKMSLPLNEVVWTVLQGKVLMIEDITN
jgi:hypothetical protein